jgi:hypothetical protein
MLAPMSARATSPLSQYYTVASRPHGARCRRSCRKSYIALVSVLHSLPADRIAPHAGALVRKSYIALVPVLHSCQQTAWRHMQALLPQELHRSCPSITQLPVDRMAPHAGALAARATSLLSQYYTVASRMHGATCWRSCRKIHIAFVPVLHSCQQTALRHMLLLLTARATTLLSQYYADVVRSDYRLSAAGLCCASKPK